MLEPRTEKKKLEKAGYIGKCTRAAFPTSYALIASNEKISKRAKDRVEDEQIRKER